MREKTKQISDSLYRNIGEKESLIKAKREEKR